MKWFVRVYRRRSLSSALWLCALSIPLLVIYKTLTMFSLYQPLQSVYNSLCDVWFFNALFLCCLHMTSLSIVMAMYALVATVTLPIYITRLSILWSALCPTHFAVIVVLGVCGGVKGHCLSGLSGHTIRSVEWAFLTLHGVLTGVWWGVHYYTHKRMVLVLPSLQQGPLFSLRGVSLTLHLRQGLLTSLKDLRWTVPLYLLLSWYYGTGWLTFHLWWCIICAGTLITALRSFGLSLFTVFQTQAINFPVVPTFTSERDHLLIDALQSPLPLLKALALLDVTSLAGQPARRAQVYSLDHSGQPRVWTVVCEQCLAPIHCLIGQLSGDVTPPVHQLPTNSTKSPMISRGKGWSTPQPPLITRRAVLEKKAELWSYSPPTIHTPTPPLHTHTLSHNLANKLKGVRQWVNSLPSTVNNWLKKRPLFAHFLSPLPGSEERLLYRESAVTVLAVRGLTELVVTSYTEDQYGVVQASLNKVLTALINLSMALDKHVKAPLSSTPSTSDPLYALEKNGKYAIKTAVLTGLHRLEATFARERKSFNLSEQQLKYWTLPKH